LGLGFNAEAQRFRVMGYRLLAIGTIIGISNQSPIAKSL
jgi:hypothetical protein